ncbi:MAG TPA: DUF6089 family protein [Saprospiraceae bacterium]|nr:DUF6089 family protein [Saprospiraceae bacterium]HMX82912.1 DUF6089 family protein [Saprospiraceae bacterium]HMX85568.1 DUF6089 family protein [Saprospiraceae bacterium]HMZ73986.1 DUF6089 family protein [Saprospiraceae bacterium]HNA93133.1 DUF6089 family protein [Saprospiraceae bacterium]
MKNFLVIILLLAGSGYLSAQRGWELGGMAGVSNYFGDLNSNYGLNHIGPSARLFARYNFNTRLCLKFAASYARVAGYDSDSDNTFEKQRNLSFASNIFDGAAEFEFNFMPYVHGSAYNNFTPYGFLGLAAFKFNPKTKYEDKWYELQPLGTEGQFLGQEYSLLQLGFAYGLGLKWDINYDWSINVELASRYLFTDYLDDVSTIYPDAKDVQRLHGDIAAALVDRSGELGIEPPIGQKGRQRGNSKDNDSYQMLTVGLSYYFGTIRCPSISNYY